MKFTADTKDLARAVKATKKAAPARPSWELLSGYRVDALDGIVAITATDLETGRRVEIEARIDEPGTILMPPRFPSVVTAATAEVTTVSGTEKIMVTSGASRWQLQPLNVEDYPSEPTVEGETIALPDWARIQAVSVACSVEDKRPILAGVCFGDGAVAATDSYRLAWTEIDSDAAPIIIPARAIGALSEAPTKATSDGRTIKATTDDGVWWSRLIEGAFPKWRTLVPKDEAGTRITLRSEDLADTIGRAMLVLEDERPIYLDVTANEVRILGDKTGERFSEPIDAKIEGDPIMAAYRGRYLVDLTTHTDEVMISLWDEFKPALIQGAGWWNALLMPVSMERK